MRTAPTSPRIASNLRQACMSAAAAFLLSASGSAQDAIWTAIQFGASPQPSGRWIAESFDYDRVRGQFVLFGGISYTPTIHYGDTWLLQSGTWVQQTTPGPSGRAGAGMAWDSVRQEVLLYGGVGPNGWPNDTWSWNGAAWHQLNPAVSPPARHVMGMATDDARGRIVMFGGWAGSWAPPDTRLGDTWEWDGATNNWIQMQPPVSPPPRWELALAYDAARATIVMFGGENGASLNDTWEYRGTTWTNAVTAHTPPGRNYHRLEYSPRFGGCVTFGGGGNASCTTLDDLWIFDGSDWRSIASQTMPSQREGVGMALDPGSGRILVTHGRDQRCATNPTFFVESYWLDVAQAASFSNFGSGCAGANGTPNLAAAPNSLPRLGQTFILQLNNLPITGFFVTAIPFLGFDNASSGGAPLPRDLGFLGMPGCNQLVDPFQTGFLFTPTGTANWPINVPNLPAFAGFQVHFQALVVDPPANQLGATVTNAGTATLGV